MTDKQYDDAILDSNAIDPTDVTAIMANALNRAAGSIPSSKKSVPASIFR